MNDAATLQAACHYRQQAWCGRSCRRRTGGEEQPDGYTLVLTTIAHNGAQKLYKNLLRYNPSMDLEPVILLAESPSVLLVHESIPARSVQELLALARAKPGALKYASAGNGSAMHPRSGAR